MTNSQAYETLTSMIQRAVEVNLQYNEMHTADQMQHLYNFARELQKRITEENGSITSPIITLN